MPPPVGTPSCVWCPQIWSTYVTPDDATASWHAELRMVSPDLVDRAAGRSPCSRSPVPLRMRYKGGPFLEVHLGAGQGLPPAARRASRALRRAPRPGPRGRHV